MGYAFNDQLSQRRYGTMDRQYQIQCSDSYLKLIGLSNRYLLLFYQPLHDLRKRSASIQRAQNASAIDKKIVGIDWIGHFS